MLKIVNLHTSAATGPSTRMAEIEATVKAHLEQSGRCIVVGDFNMFSTPAWALLLALPFGYRLPDMVTFERRTVENWWKGKGFDAAIRGVTMPRWRLQLDQVFLKNTNAVNAEIIDKNFGSDHLPIKVELSVPK
ncbi:hypothetical protein ROA7450_03087 [Roseovarius albus]|uniref:Endonuclease/exonuclease/phosphatase domain-containing protein n=2 Tax=Roseovarius albus TaxID=1247867 RepID=A0A1X6ZS10_9RHOB|nr:hypothetical protein ROA7450_03087 [Roseovarius albus]